MLNTYNDIIRQILYWLFSTIGVIFDALISKVKIYDDYRDSQLQRGRQHGSLNLNKENS